MSLYKTVEKIIAVESNFVMCLEDNCIFCSLCVVYKGINVESSDANRMTIDLIH